MQIGGWGNRSPFSKRSGISRVGIPSYGFPPKVISSQIVTPRQKKRESVFEVILHRFFYNFLQGSILAPLWTVLGSSLPVPAKTLTFGLPFKKLQKTVKQHFVLVLKINFPRFHWCAKQHDRAEALEKGLRQINGGEVNGCSNNRMHHTLLSYQKGKWMADVRYYFTGKKHRSSLT